MFRHKFLGVFSKLRKATSSFVMAVCPPVRPYGTTGLPLDRFAWTLILENLLRKLKFVI